MYFCDITIGDCVSCFNLCVSCERPSPDCILQCHGEYMAYCVGQNEMHERWKQNKTEVNVTRTTPIDISVGDLHIKPLILFAVGMLITMLVTIVCNTTSFWKISCFRKKDNSQAVSPIVIPVCLKDNCGVYFHKPRRHSSARIPRTISSTYIALQPTPGINSEHSMIHQEQLASLSTLQGAENIVTGEEAPNFLNAANHACTESSSTVMPLGDEAINPLLSQSIKEEIDAQLQYRGDSNVNIVPLDYDSIADLIQFTQADKNTQTHLTMSMLDNDE